jgi:hypothetical protein
MYKVNKNHRVIFDSKERFDEEYIKETREMLAECNELEPEEVPDFWIGDCFWDGLDDEKANLNVETGGHIIAFCDLGFWYGRQKMLFHIGTNVSDILKKRYGCDEVEWFADRYNIRFNGSHHDGSHHILFRYVESREKYEHLGERLANGNLNEEQFRKATKSIRKFVANVYGW